jgi:hypothetical protein
MEPESQLPCSQVCYSCQLNLIHTVTPYFLKIHFNIACLPELQSWVSLGLLYNQSPPGVRFLNKIIFYRMELLAPCPTTILEDQGVSLSLDSTL